MIIIFTARILCTTLHVIADADGRIDAMLRRLIVENAKYDRGKLHVEEH